MHFSGFIFYISGMHAKLLVLLLGSNLGDRSGNLHKTSLMIRECFGHIASASSVYETAPWGYASENSFLNQCLAVWSEMDPERILEQIHMIEAKLGRRGRSPDYADRIIDIDILFYGDTILTYPDLHIPHKKVHERRFSLVPLAEILPDFEHPVFRKKIRTLLAECRDELPVERITES
jgi:2-amino-4-hydroxy-6-hydroxymethyldihydropteridine diphosphokinase